MLCPFRVEAKTTVMALRRVLSTFFVCLLAFILFAPASLHAQEHRAGGEANLILPDLDMATFFGMGGRSLLMLGLIVGALGLVFGYITFIQLKNLPVHSSTYEMLP